MHWTDNLRKLGACSDAVEWAKKYPTLEAAWDVCARGDWMLLRAIETAEAYCRGEASLEEVRAAAVYAAAYAAAAYAAAVYAAAKATDAAREKTLA